MWMVFLQPNSNVRNPNVSIPAIPPTVLIDAIQESCSTLKGPVIKGVSFDIRMGVAGDIHPLYQNSQTRFCKTFVIKNLRMQMC